MRGTDEGSERLFSYVDLEGRVPKGHPLAAMLEVGRVALSGPSAELQQHESIRRSYLGY